MIKTVLQVVERSKGHSLLTVFKYFLIWFLRSIDGFNNALVEVPVEEGRCNSQTEMEESWVVSAHVCQNTFQIRKLHIDNINFLVNLNLKSQGWLRIRICVRPNVQVLFVGKVVKRIKSFRSVKFWDHFENIYWVFETLFFIYKRSGYKNGINNCLVEREIPCI